MSLISKLYSADECRELDRLAIEEHGIPGFTLMQRAGSFVFTTIQDRWPGIRSLLVVAGSGNNAGDGYIVAKLAHEAGLDTEIQQIGDPRRLRGDALLAWQQLPDHEFLTTSNSNTPDVIVDALLGTGARGTLSSTFDRVIAQINETDRPTVAIDVPSGIDANTGGKLTENPVNATLTCMFIGAKLGLFTGHGLQFRGDVVFTDLGVPREIYHEELGVPLLDSTNERTVMPPRDALAHKFQLGHVVIVGGDYGMGGAVLLAAAAALRTGAGLVTVLTRPEHVPAVLAKRPEVMVVGIDESTDVSSYISRADVLAIGPGLGQQSWGKTLLGAALATTPQRCVLDADALRILKAQDWQAPRDSIFTPHPGEAAQLAEAPTAEVQSNRPKCVTELSRKYGCTVILKGPGSLIASHGKLCSVSPYVNGSLATAGSGDVLTGIAAAIFARIGAPVQTAETAVSLHAAAGVRAERDQPGQSLIASDLIEAIRI